MKYKIAADSSANLYRVRPGDSQTAVPEQDNVDYVSVPLKIITDEREFVDVENMDLREMVSYLQGYKGRSGTSCPNVNDWLEAFGDADVVFAVTITSGLSGSYASAVKAREEYMAEHPDTKVMVLDSLSAGPEMELIVEEMFDAVQGGGTYEEMSRRIRDYASRSHLLFCLKHLDNLARNGRVNPAVAKLAGILGIRIVGKASDEGMFEQLHKCRGEAAAVAKIWQEMLKHGYNGGKVRLAHCFGPEIARKLMDTIHERFPGADVRIRACTALCSFYAEEGGLMVGYEG